MSNQRWKASITKQSRCPVAIPPLLIFGVATSAFQPTVFFKLREYLALSTDWASFDSSVGY
ncbi:hypothetical protein FA13DRAFT_1738052 [Coprinellus micaceus]|uniref:Uncharacterized protein n=1 Tax=Coprinellus micaceus TaxID=71717 RepID=A0A4Y7SDU4_COPMI|nr:hypothetical protein FA13DRAFT_1743743 [Coprinellus micaceus]TEB25715.1 hypothetical protein FA13DRAFT_1738052 [Coprinellus micaceus]